MTALVGDRFYPLRQQRNDTKERKEQKVASLPTLQS